MEMDCAVVVEDGEAHRASEQSNGDDEEPRDYPRAYTKVLNAIEEGDMVVTDETGIKVQPPERPRDSGGAFGFMQGGVSSERPSESTIRKIANAIKETKKEGGKVMAVCGPASSTPGRARTSLASSGRLRRYALGRQRLRRP